jgi:hypothetical protein
MGEHADEQGKQRAALGKPGSNYEHMNSFGETWH